MRLESKLNSLNCRDVKEKLFLRRFGLVICARVGFLFINYVNFVSQANVTFNCTYQLVVPRLKCYLKKLKAFLTS